MRPKLVLGVSFLAAFLGAGSYIGIVLGISLNPSQPGLIVTASLLLPIAAIIFASIFVYRHTARRRKLQALVTAILATVLTLTVFVLATIFIARRYTKLPTVTPLHSSN